MTMLWNLLDTLHSSIFDTTVTRENFTVIPYMNVPSNTFGTMDLSCLERMTMLWNLLDTLHSSKLYSDITVTRENLTVIPYMNVHSNTVY